MKTLRLLVAAFILFLLSTSVMAQDNIPDSLMQKWGPVIRAIEQVESKGQDRLVSRNGLYVGCLQIAPILVRQVNIILGKKKFTNNDRFSKEKSYEMFIVFQEHFNPGGDHEFAIRLWNSGDLKCMERKGRTETYYQRVMSKYKQLAEEKEKEKE